MSMFYSTIRITKVVLVRCLLFEILLCNDNDKELFARILCRPPQVGVSHTIKHSIYPAKSHPRRQYKNNQSCTSEVFTVQDSSV